VALIERHRERVEAPEAEAEPERALAARRLHQMEEHVGGVAARRLGRGLHGGVEEPVALVRREGALDVGVPRPVARVEQMPREQRRGRAHERHEPEAQRRGRGGQLGGLRGLLRGGRGRGGAPRSVHRIVRR